MTKTQGSDLRSAVNSMLTARVSLLHAEQRYKEATGKYEALVWKFEQDDDRKAVQIAKAVT
jgi:hypothetical protein